jgi:hypothetical protein
MERTAAPKPSGSRRRKAPTASAPGLPEDDRFSPHPGQSIDAIYVIARGFELIVARPGPVIGVLLASAVVSGVLLFALVALGVVENALFTSLGITGPEHPAAMMLLLVLGWSCALLLQAPLVGSAIEVNTQQRRGLHMEFLRRGLARLGDLVLAGLAVLGISLAVLVAAVLLQVLVAKISSFVPWQLVRVMLGVAGFVAVTIAALRVINALALVVPVIVVEQLPAPVALRRAWVLGWPNSMPMLMAFVLPVVTFQGVLHVLSFLPGFISIPATIIIDVGMTLYLSVLVPVSYVAIREYVDGIDPERLVRMGRH